MEENKTFTPDEGYFFGLGFFETIAVEKGQPLLLDWHLERLVDSCRLLGITFPCSAENVEKILSEKDCPEKGVLKIVASSENILFLTRENHYGPADYGDCILEKRAVRGTEIQEPIFLNTRGEIAEGATSNIFFVKDGILYTPEVDSGLLPGILRRWVLENAEKEGKPVVERRILPEDVKDFEECFVTNSLMGIMPVTALGEVEFQSRKVTESWMAKYEDFVYKAAYK